MSSAKNSNTWKAVYNARYPATVISDLHPVQTGTHAQQKRTLEQIRDFNGTLQKALTSFQLIDFFGEMR